jgi:isocitrate dehydrogenase
LNAAQGSAVNIGGYYLPDVELTAMAMRPSRTFNSIIEHI